MSSCLINGAKIRLRANDTTAGASNHNRPEGPVNGIRTIGLGQSVQVLLYFRQHDQAA